MNRKTFLLPFLLSLIVVTLIFISGCVNNGNNNNSKHDTLAQCLSEKGVVMYGTDRCPNCQSQKELFGESFKFVQYVNCDYEYDKCSAENVERIPTWMINGEEYIGVQTLERLANLSGCQLE